MSAASLASVGEEEAEKIPVADVLLGERVRIEYTSTQSYNTVERVGRVSDVSRSRGSTHYFELKADNGTTYVVRRSRVKSTGQNSRRLSRGAADVYRIEKLDFDTVDEFERSGALRISREATREDCGCPKCNSREDDTDIYGVRKEAEYPLDGGIVFECYSCGKKTTIDTIPETIEIRVAR